MDRVRYGTRGRDDLWAVPLRVGRYRVTWQIQPTPGARSPVTVCEVCAGSDAAVLVRHEVQPHESRVSVEFEVAETTFGFQFRCVSTAGAGFSVLRKIELDEYPRLCGNIYNSSVRTQGYDTRPILGGFCDGEI
jgi:hypothetical protein